MKLKPYPSYKDSGEEWLGSVPSEWDVKPLKYIATVNDDVLSELTEPEEEIEYVDIGSVTVEKGIEKTEAMRFSVAPSRARRKVRDGDVIVSTVRTYLKAIAPITNPPSNLVCSTGFAVIRPGQKLNPKYAKYSMQTVYFIDEVIARSVGVSYPAINSSEMMCIRMTAPSICDQSIIANYLDRETAKLDTLIAKQEKLIELLQEKRQAIISHAVTKGLDPNVKMKDSGLEWLGLVPEHWVITRLKYLGDAIIGLTYDPAEVVDEGNGTLVLRSSNIQMGEASFDDNVYVKKQIPEKLYTRIGDILICSRNGSRKLIGKNITIDENTAGLSFGAFMTIFRSKYYKYVSCVLNSSLFEFQAGSFLTSTVNQLTTGNLNSFEVPFPPEDEQIKIANYVNEQTTKIDTLISKAQKTIELAIEHRIALISAAVTGKIDVRDIK